MPDAVAPPPASPFQDPALVVGNGGLYLTGEDNFRITSWGALAGAVISIEGRIVDCHGKLMPFSYQHVPNSDRSAATQLLAACEGLLTNVHARVSTGTATVGLVGVLLEIVRGSGPTPTPIGTLLQGYITSATRRAWPGSPIAQLVDGAGRIRTILGADPAAGAEISETVPAGARWRLRTFAYTLVTSAAVVNRVPVLTIDDGANIFWEAASNVAQTATQTAKYRAGAGVPLGTFAALAYWLPLPSDLTLQAGCRIRTVTAAIDAGDNYGPPVYQVEELLEQ
jgi:hypothetical protein